MSYELTERIIAIDPASVGALWNSLSEQYGETLTDGAETVTTIGAHWDDTNKTRLRAASIHKGTISDQPLTDGRVAFRCLWQSDLAAAFDAGHIAGAEELTQLQLAQLTPQPEEAL